MKAFRHLTHSYVLRLSDFLQKVNNNKHEILHTIKTCVCVCGTWMSGNHPQVLIFFLLLFYINLTWFI